MAKRPARRPRAEWSRKFLSPLALPPDGISRHGGYRARIIWHGSSGSLSGPPAPSLSCPHQMPHMAHNPLIALGTFSRRSSKKTFMWLKNPPAAAQKSPPCGSKIPLWIGRQGGRGGIARFTEGTCGPLASRPGDGSAAPHANFTDSGGIWQSPSVTARRQNRIRPPEYALFCDYIASYRAP